MLKIRVSLVVSVAVADVSIAWNAKGSGTVWAIVCCLAGVAFGVAAWLRARG